MGTSATTAAEIASAAASRAAGRYCSYCSCCAAVPGVGHSDNRKMPDLAATPPARAAVQARESAGLSRRLRKLERVPRVSAIQGTTLGEQQVVAYCERCHDACRKYPSAEGAVHMALNDGDGFDPDGFYGQLRRMERDWTATPPADVLERAFGQGFDPGYLATRHPTCRFSGIDLTPSHLARAAARLGRLALARRHPMRGRNVLAGYLMHSTVRLGLIGYRHTVFQKS